jgi:hypothetical protein
VRAVLAIWDARISPSEPNQLWQRAVRIADLADNGRLEPDDRIGNGDWGDAVEASNAFDLMLYPRQGEPHPLLLKLSLSKHDRDIFRAGCAFDFAIYDA